MTALGAECVPDFSRIGYSQAMRRGVAIAREAGRSLLLMTDGSDVGARHWAFLMDPPASARVRLVERADFDAWLAHWESRTSALGLPARREAGTAVKARPVEELTLASIGDEADAVVRFLDSTLFDALRVGASDVHLESVPTGLQVKFRLDGVLVESGHLGGVAEAARAISRIKVLSDLDIAERRIPQDGRMSVGFAGRSVDVRVSVMPSVHGEDAVLRILDREHLARSLQGLTLAKLGLEADLVAEFKRLCARPYGLVLVTGPTGSGKTTTLYAALSETRNPREKVVTIEDPVEYQLEGVLQIPVNEKKGLTFARGLRSILRHDPDRILVGEIRDAETAQIAVQSALTGHLVYATVHANNAFDVLSRLTQLGSDAFALAAALNGVLAQRLIRLLCTACAQPDDQALFGEAGIETPPHAIVRPMRAVGCDACRGTGYRGRRAIGELLVLTPALKAMLFEKRSWLAAQQLARDDGMTSLRERAITMALIGETTLEEADRVTLAA